MVSIVRPEPGSGDRPVEWQGSDRLCLIAHAMARRMPPRADACAGPVDGVTRPIVMPAASRGLGRGVAEAGASDLLVEADLDCAPLERTTAGRARFTPSTRDLGKDVVELSADHDGPGTDPDTLEHAVAPLLATKTAHRGFSQGPGGGGTGLGPAQVHGIAARPSRQAASDGPTGEGVRMSVPVAGHAASGAA